MKKTQGFSSTQQKVVPVIFADGINGFINPNTIPDSKWNYHHGKTATGQKVNSMKTTKIGESLLIQGNTGPTLSVTQDEFEVAAMQILTEMGYSIKSPL